MVVAVIPARIGSTRLPGKALADIGGRPMVVRVWERTRRARVDRVLVATDDERVAAAVRRAGGEAVLTGEATSGTGRVAVAMRGLTEGVVVNVQGDEPFVDPAAIDAVAGAVDGAHPIATAACSLDHGAEEPSRVKVVADQAGRALYFSRLPIPRGGPWRLHLGIYAFAASALQAVAALPVGALERAESLEQLRWLEAGWAIKVVAVERGEPGVDTPADLERARTRVREVET